MKIRLGKEEILRIFCFCREAERSFHRALADPWPDFLAYYTPAKQTDIGQSVEAVNRLLGRSDACPKPPARAEIEKRLGRALFLRARLGRWFARRWTNWSFAADEVCFLSASLSALLQLLHGSEKPANQQLVELRMAFCDCERLIESRCYGLPELELARKMDHFNRTEWLPKVTLSDVLKRSA